MNLGDLKVYGFNTFSLMISFSSAEDTLKIILLIATIGYTMQKWYLMNKKDD